MVLLVALIVSIAIVLANLLMMFIDFGSTLIHVVFIVCAVAYFVLFAFLEICDPRSENSAPKRFFSEVKRFVNKLFHLFISEKKIARKYVDKHFKRYTKEFMSKASKDEISELASIVKGLKDYDTCDSRAFGIFYKVCGNKKNEEPDKGQETVVEKLADAFETRSAVTKGTNFVAELSTKADLVTNENVKHDIEIICSSLENIYSNIKKCPGTAGRVERLHEYYLPSISDLLTKYYDLESQSFEGDNVKEAKKTIEETVKTFAESLNNLQEQMFDNVVLNISTEAETIKNMLKQEGLATSPFKVSDDVSGDKLLTRL